MKKWKQLAEKSREDVEHELRIDSSERRHSLIQFGEHSEDDASDGADKQDDGHDDLESTTDDPDTDTRSNDGGSTSPSRRVPEDEDNDHNISDKHDIENVQGTD